MNWLLAVARFPPPDFSETNHQLPAITGPLPRAGWLEHMDLFILFGALCLATWLALRVRSRRGLVILGLFSLGYFGFWRKGCVCSIGSIQNVAQALADSSFGVSASVLGFAVLPLAFALLFGRVFCSAVCPHGALQDLMLVKPVKVPSWLEEGLRLVPYTYLGLAMIFAATGSGYIICQYDPFVTVFRLSGSALMVSFAIGLLAMGLFVGRPYCRFLCPYGALLGLASKLSKWRVKITPDTCTQCRLCEQSCPFSAINPSSVEMPVRDVAAGKRRLGMMILLLPILLCLGYWLAGTAGKSMVAKHRTVALAQQVYLEDTGAIKEPTKASQAFRDSGTPVEQLYAQARQVQDRFLLAARLGGLWIALVIGGKLISLAVNRKRRDYEADQTRCVACARCFKDCPQELQRLGIPVPQPLQTTATK